MRNGRLKRLERLARGRLIRIPQRGGGVAEFRRGDVAEAFVNALARLKGERVEAHALSIAAQSSSDPAWRDGLVADMGIVVRFGEGEREEVPPGSVPDLSE